MRRFKTDILVRDNRVELMEKSGLKVYYDILNDENFAVELKTKVIEEAMELAKAKGLDKVKEEVVDVWEVLEHIISFYNFDKNELENIKLKKQQKLGKFDKRIKTYFVEMADDSPDVEYYLANAEKYPEVV